MVQDHTLPYIIEKLYTLYKERGVLREDDALDIMSSYNVSLIEINQITNKLFARGVLFSFGNDQDENDYSDYGFIDYDCIYKEIISIDEDLNYLINTIKKIKPPQRNEFNNLYLQAKSNNSYAKNRILEMYMRQAVRQALYFSKKYSNPLADCIQEAFVGLISGFEKYNINRSQKFPIYIIWWIRQMLYRSIFLGNNVFDFPYHIKEKQFKTFKLFKDRSASDIILERSNIIKKIQKLLSCSKNKAKFLYKLFLDNIDIEEVILSDNNISIDNLNENITNYNLKNSILSILSTIPQRESEILLMRFGINNDKEYTLDEIGEYLGVTRERIRQIEAKALRRLRHKKRSKILSKYLHEHRAEELTDENLPKNEKFIE